MKRFFSFLPLFLLLVVCQVGVGHAEEQEEMSVKAIGATLQPELANKVFNRINNYRVNHSLPRLVWSEVVAQQARKHSLDMARGTVPFGHQGAEQRFNRIRQSIPNATSFGENVAFNQGFSNPAAAAVKGWIHSPEHRANILGDFNLTGVGVARNRRGEYYFTQIFIKTQGPRSLIERTADIEFETQKIESVSEFPIHWEVDDYTD